MSARMRFDAYVKGLTQSPVVRSELGDLADDMHRESVQAAGEPHYFFNDVGGTEVCTVCWGGRGGGIHSPEAAR